MNWYLCEVIVAGGGLPAGATKGKKVYCKRAYPSSNPKLGGDKRAQLGHGVVVLDVVNNFNRRTFVSKAFAKKSLKIIKRLTDSQSKALDVILLTGETRWHRTWEA